MLSTIRTPTRALKTGSGRTVIIGPVQGSNADEYVMHCCCIVLLLLRQLSPVTLHLLLATILSILFQLMDVKQTLSDTTMSGIV